MKKPASYTIHEYNTLIFTIFEVMIPFTLCFLWILRLPSADPRDTVIIRSIGKFVYAYVFWGIYTLWSFFSGDYKKLLFQIDSNGIAFSKKGFFYEYEWEEIEYVRQHNILGAPRLFIKVYGKQDEYCLNYECYMWTFIFLRRAFYRFVKGDTKYYTMRQWKRRKATLSSVSGEGVKSKKGKKQ